MFFIVLRGCEGILVISALRTVKMKDLSGVASTGGVGRCGGYAHLVLRALK